MVFLKKILGNEKFFAAFFVGTLNFPEAFYSTNDSLFFLNVFIIFIKSIEKIFKL
jgi:hypothetical protein